MSAWDDENRAPATSSLAELRTQPDVDGGPGTPASDAAAAAVQRVSHELDVRADPDRALGDRRFVWPWGEHAEARAKARRAALEARLDVFRDDLRSNRIAHEVLERARTMQAVEAAEGMIFELRARGETIRLAVLNRAQVEMTRLFVQQIETIDGFRGRLTPEIVDALKQRALEEFTERMNRASKADVEFNRRDILELK